MTGSVIYRRIIRKPGGIKKCIRKRDRIDVIREFRIDYESHWNLLFLARGKLVTGRLAQRRPGRANCRALESEHVDRSVPYSKVEMALHLSNRNRIIAGVCGGLAEWLGWSPTWVRILYVLISILSAAFPGILAYIVLWIVVPRT